MGIKHLRVDPLKAGEDDFISDDTYKLVQAEAEKKQNLTWAKQGDFPGRKPVAVFSASHLKSTPGVASQHLPEQEAVWRSGQRRGRGKGGKGRDKAKAAAAAARVPAVATLRILGACYAGPTCGGPRCGTASLGFPGEGPSWSSLRNRPVREVAVSVTTIHFQPGMKVEHVFISNARSILAGDSRGRARRRRFGRAYPTKKSKEC